MKKQSAFLIFGVLSLSFLFLFSFSFPLAESATVATDEIACRPPTPEQTRTGIGVGRTYQNAHNAARDAARAKCQAIYTVYCTYCRDQGCTCKSPDAEDIEVECTTTDPACIAKDDQGKIIIGRAGRDVCVVYCIATCSSATCTRLGRKEPQPLAYTGSGKGSA